MNSDLTEITETREEQSPEHSGPSAAGKIDPPWKHGPAIRGWILYDGDCRYCVAAAKQFEGLLARRGFVFLPLQTPWVQERLGLEPDAPLQEMRVLTVDRRDFGGADAVIFLAQQMWWSTPFAVLATLPGIHGAVDRTYRWIAAHRGCTHLACKRAKLPGSAIPARPRIRTCRDWFGLVVLPLLALLTRKHVPAWLFMWFMAGAIFLGCKWLTFWRTTRRAGIGATRRLGYFFLWAGMDAAHFLAPPVRRPSSSVETRRIIPAALKILLGLTLLFATARSAPYPLLTGWIGMIGMILILHFGLFDLAAAGWRMAGVNAKPIMNAPLRSASLNEFWGRRWNNAFNQLVLDIFFRKLARSMGSVRATLSAFLLSGLIHELVISLPAAAGYGLPTAYFLLQGWGVIAQHSELGHRLRFRRGLGGRIFTIVITAGPAFWLFHPPFVRNVILPFMKAIGAL